LFEPQNTEAQNVALRRLETLLALIEGWVDAVVSQAAGERMPGGPALTEAMRRRRASGGPAEQTFAALVGLELRPRRLRDAAALWAAMYQMHGTSTRDGLWNHPDLLPSAEDLDDPMGFAAEHGATHDLQMPELDDPDLATFKPLEDRAEDRGGLSTEAATPAAEDATRSDAAAAQSPDSGAPDTGAAETGSDGSAGPSSEPGESQTDSSGS
jgi:Zincin-like metallopeptidase